MHAKEGKGNFNYIYKVEKNIKLVMGLVGRVDLFVLWDEWGGWIGRNPKTHFHLENLHMKNIF